MARYPLVVIVLGLALSGCVFSPDMGDGPQCSDDGDCAEDGDCACVNGFRACVEVGDCPGMEICDAFIVMGQYSVGFCTVE